MHSVRSSGILNRSTGSHFKTFLRKKKRHSVRLINKRCKAYVTARRSPRRRSSTFSRILDLAGPFPFYLQIACSVFFEMVKSGRGRDASMLRDAKRQFLEEAGVHFKNTWEKSVNRSKGCLPNSSPAKSRQKLKTTSSTNF